QIADRLATSDPRVRVVHHDRPRNLGYAYKVGVGLARFEHVLMFPGDNEGTDEQLDALMSRAGTADVVINYISNAEVRGWRRRPDEGLSAPERDRRRAGTLPAHCRRPPLTSRAVRRAAARRRPRRPSPRGGGRASPSRCVEDR